MKLLLVAPHFFGFDAELFYQIRANINDCKLLSEKPYSGNIFILSILQKLPSPIFSYIFTRYVSGIANNGFIPDIFLLIRGEHFRALHLERLRSAFPSSKFLLYQWDASENLPNLLEQIPFFDKVITFNPNDAKTFGLTFQPLFFKSYLRSFPAQYPLSRPKYKVAFVGTDYDDRYEVINCFQVQNNIPDNKFFCHLYRSRASYIYNRFLRGGGNLTHKAYKFNPHPLGEASVISAFWDSEAVLDINPESQVGLSARTFEALALNKKLITTNRSIVDYDFYDPRNIYIIDRNNLFVPDSFFNTSYVQPSDSVLDKYSSVNWLKRVLSI
jgi:hypothetical protein